MKAIFEDNGSSLKVGSKKEFLVLEAEYNDDTILIELSLLEAYKLQSYVSTCIQEMERSERLKLPFWKRLL
jgi:hypothetical protein